MFKNWRTKKNSATAPLISNGTLQDLDAYLGAPSIFTPGSYSGTLVGTFPPRAFKTGDLVHWKSYQRCHTAVVVNESIWLDCDTRDVIYPFLDETAHMASDCHG